MFEHPYFSQQLTRYDQEQMERAAARRRSLLERADQIVPRPAGPVRQVLRRMLGRSPGRTAADRAPLARTTSGASTCDPATAVAR